jgi:hypothetical protein
VDFVLVKQRKTTIARIAVSAISSLRLLLYEEYSMDNNKPEFPQDNLKHGDNKSYEIGRSAEEKFFFAAQTLNSDYHVIYSKSWQYHVNGYDYAGEADFIIFRKGYGFIVVECKANEDLSEDVRAKAVGQAWKSCYVIKDAYIKSKVKAFEDEYGAERAREWEKNTYFEGLYGHAIVTPNAPITDKPGLIDPRLWIDKYDFDVDDGYKKFRAKIAGIFKFYDERALYDSTPKYYKGLLEVIEQYQSDYTDSHTGHVNFAEKRRQFGESIESDVEGCLKFVTATAALNAEYLLDITEKHQKAIDEFIFIQDMVAKLIRRNQFVLIDSPAGTGKTYLMIKALVLAVEEKIEELKGKTNIEAVLELQALNQGKLRTLLYVCSTLRLRKFVKAYMEKHYKDIVNKIKFYSLYTDDKDEINYLELMAQNGQKLDFICVDEGQDFPLSKVETIKELLDSDSKLWVFADSQQFTYNTLEVKKSDYAAEEVKKCWFPEEDVYTDYSADFTVRNTKAIADYITKTLSKSIDEYNKDCGDASKIDKERYTLKTLPNFPQGLPVTYKDFPYIRKNTYPEVFDYVEKTIEELTAQGIEPKDIFVTTDCKKLISLLGGKTTINGYSFGRQTPEQSDKEFIDFEHASNLKGIESQVVINITFKGGYRDSKAYPKEFEHYINRRYASLSRARFLLYDIEIGNFRPY